jgi:hypothetical protein
LAKTRAMVLALYMVSSGPLLSSKFFFEKRKGSKVS